MHQQLAARWRISMAAMAALLIFAVLLALAATEWSIPAVLILVLVSTVVVAVAAPLVSESNWRPATVVAISLISVVGLGFWLEMTSAFAGSPYYVFSQLSRDEQFQSAVATILPQSLTWEVIFIFSLLPFGFVLGWWSRKLAGNSTALISAVIAVSALPLTGFWIARDPLTLGSLSLFLAGVPFSFSYSVRAVRRSSRRWPAFVALVLSTLGLVFIALLLASIVDAILS